VARRQPLRNKGANKLRDPDTESYQKKKAELTALWSVNVGVLCGAIGVRIAEMILAAHYGEHIPREVMAGDDLFIAVGAAGQIAAFIGRVLLDRRHNLG
jgi:hypothetical protein